MESYCETWPRAGIVCGGTAYRLRPLAPLTDVIGYSSLATPTATANQLAPSMVKKHASCRGWAIWPTPIARDARTIAGAARPPNSKGSEPLAVVVGQTDGVTTGRLNPQWVEGLMGFPAGWTDATDCALLGTQ